MTTSPRQIVLLLPPSDACDSPDALLQAAASLAPTAPLKVIAIGAPAHAAFSPRALPTGAQWWACLHASLTRVDAEQLVPALLQALHTAQADDQSLILMPPGALTEECANRVAAQLNGSYLGRSNEVAIHGDEVHVTRASFGGRVNTQLRSAASVCVATWRPSSVPKASGAAQVSAWSMPALTECTLTAALPALANTAPIASTDSLPPLENARLVVGGGRGMQGDEGFALLAQLAQRLGASLGGSLPTVDAGWVPVARQIGQSGKFVNPRAYFTVGISGTPQHLAGVSTDTRIIAVNKDPEAPIFARAEVGVVAQWQDLLPELLKELAAMAPAPVAATA